MELTIHAYGYAYYIFNTLNAIAMIRNSSLYPAMINVSVLMVGVYYAMRAASSSGDGEWRVYIRKAIGMVVLVNALLLPKTSMNIKDHVEKHLWQVDNIPLAFALPIGVVEELGSLLTIAFEQAFSVIGGRSGFDYYNYGTVFGARLAREVMQVHVRNPEYVSNMKGFIERCVIMPAMIGEQFTKEELVATKDMWGLVSTNAGTFTRVPMTINGTKQSPSPTCKEAVPYFEKQMQKSASTDIVAMSIALRAPGAEAKYNPTHNAMNEALKSQISALYGNESSVENILKHNMMVNALNNYRGAKYPAVKAALQHEAGGLLSGDMADKVLTGLLSIFKNLLYGSFIFVVPLIIFAGGMSKYRSWITVCLSLQLWPPLYAMLNMMMDLAYDPAHIVSYSSWSTETKQMDKIASMAAHLSLLIPVLAVYMTRLGEGGLLHMAGSLMSSASGGVAAAASEQASGSRSYDNESIGNRSSRNVSSNKYDDSMQYVSGGNMSINPDGSFEKILPSGNVITMAGAGSTSSSGESVYRETDGISSSMHEGIRAEHQLMTSETAELSKAKESLIAKEASALTTIAANTRTENGYNIDTSTEEGKEVVSALNKIDEMSKNSENTWQQNAEAFARLEFDGGPASKLGNILGFSAKAGGQITANNTSTQQDSSSSKVSSDLNTSDRNSTSTRNNKHEAWLASVGIDKSKQDSMRESASDVTRLQESISSHKEKIEGYNKGLEYVQQHGSEYQRDMTQDVIDGYRKKYGVSDREAEKEVRDGSFAAKQIFRDLSSAQANKILSHVSDEGTKIMNSDAVEKFKDDHKNAVSMNVGEKGGAVDQFAKDNNIQDQETASNDINRIHDIREKEFENKSQQATNKYVDAKEANQEEKESRDKLMEQLEADRIGTGFLSTFGGLTKGLGRPPEEKIEDNSSLKVQRPASEDFDKVQAMKLVEGFKPSSNYRTTQEENEYVDARKMKN